MTEVVMLHKKSKPEYCLTPTTQAIHNLLGTTQRLGFLGVVVGNPGTGKTSAINAYTKENPNVTICRIPKAAGGLQPSLIKLAGSLDIGVSVNSGASDLYQSILTHIDYYGPELLIIDEAQHLTDEALEGIRDLYDEANIHGKRLGVVLCGNADLARWNGKRNRKYDNFAQLRGRIGMQIELNRPMDEDVEAICHHLDITGKEATNFLKKVAKNPGQLHTFDNLISVANQLHDGENALMLKHLKQAATILEVMV